MEGENDKENQQEPETTQTESEPTEVTSEEKKKRSHKKESSDEEEKDEPNPYFYPRYTPSHKDEFKSKFIDLLNTIEGTEVDRDKRDDIKSLVYEYEMHKRPQALQEIFDIVREYFTSGEKVEGDKVELLTTMSNVYEALMERVMQPKPLIEETMFFPSKENEKRLARVLSKAEKTLEICVFAFTNNRLAEAILNCHKKGVKVRIITDDECSKFFGADIWNLVLEGVECTMDRHKRFHMHNKFVVIDDLVLVTGSFNWTSQAVTGNQENLCIIDNKQFVKDYKVEFERLWEQFQPNMITPEMAQQTLDEQEIEKKRRAK